MFQHRGNITGLNLPGHGILTVFPRERLAPEGAKPLVESHELRRQDSNLKCLNQNGTIVPAGVTRGFTPWFNHLGVQNTVAHGIGTVFCTVPLRELALG